MKVLVQISIFSLIFSVFLYSDVQAQDFLESLKAKYQKYKSRTAKERIFVITDRDIYSPGEPVWFEAIIYKVDVPIISTLSTEFKLELLNSEFETVFDDQYKIERGRVSGHTAIPLDLMDGVYYLQGRTESSSDAICYRRKIIVKDKILPPFITNLSYKNGEFKPGDAVPINLEFKNYYNNPQKGVSYVIRFFDGNGLISEFEGKAKKEGKASIEFEVPEKLNSGIITYQVEAEDNGMTSNLTGILQILPTDIHLDLYAENGRLVANIPSTVNIFSYYNTGQSVAIEADLLQNGNVISKMSTENNGFGSFDVLPESGASYEIKIYQPVAITRKITFPEVVEKGVGLKAVESTDQTVKYKLSSGYIDSRLIYLAGISDGEIFWFSEHQLDKEQLVEIDLQNARGSIAHFVALNAAYMIEGEHVLGIGKKDTHSVAINECQPVASARSKMNPDISIKSGFEGEIVLSAVNSPWILPGINNPHPSVVSLPWDAIHQQVVAMYAASDMNSDFIKILAKYYVPIESGLNLALDKQGCFSRVETNSDVQRHQLYIDQFAGKYKEVKEGDFKVHSNLLVDQTFAMSNPGFVSEIDFEKAEKIPAYKQMLEKGTVPIIDILNTIKPCKLERSGIVFFSTVSYTDAAKVALLVIDGVPRGYDAALLTGMSPRSIDQIKVFTQAADIMKYSGFNAGGVIEVVTKKGVEKSKPSLEINKELQFSSPDYENSKVSGDDFRRTLSWNVCPMGSQNGKFNFVFFNSDLISGVEGSIFCIPNDGVPLYLNFTYEVR